MWIRGKFQKYITWVLVIIFGALIPGLSITTHICYARDTHEIWLLEKGHCCPSSFTTCSKSTTRPICCKQAGTNSDTLNASTNSEKTNFNNSEQTCCKKEIKVLKLKDSFLKLNVIKTWIYLPLTFLVLKGFDIISLELVSLRFHFANAPPLPYGKQLCYWLQILLN